ncbi:hypothetical protein ACLOJK_020209, partial [Asimina triloba]
MNAAVGECVLEPLGELEAHVGEIPVVRDVDSKEPRDEVEREGRPKRRPCEGEGREQREKMRRENTQPRRYIRSAPFPAQ